jgi:hypothetical protein
MTAAPCLDGRLSKVNYRPRMMTKWSNSRLARTTCPCYSDSWEHSESIASQQLESLINTPSMGITFVAARLDCDANLAGPLHLATTTRATLLHPVIKDDDRNLM